MPTKTLTARAKELGITRNVLNDARQAGVNHWSDEEMKDWLAKRRPRAGGKTKPKVEAGPVIDGDEVTVEQLERDVKAASDYNEVRTIKEKIAALLQAQKVRKEEGQLLSRKEVEERDTRIASAVKGALLKFTNDAAPMVEGLNAAKAQKVIKAQMMGILEQLASDQSEFWKNE